jgi:hypothetical protein
MTSDPLSPPKRDNESGRQLSPEQAAAAAMVAEANARGLELTGPDGLLKLVTQNVLETALNEELTDHLGHPKHQADPARETTNVRNGSRSKTVVSDAAEKWSSTCRETGKERPAVRSPTCATAWTATDQPVGREPRPWRFRVAV